MLHEINGLSDLFFLNKKNEVVCNKKKELCSRKGRKDKGMGYITYMYIFIHVYTYMIHIYTYENFQKSILLNIPE